MAMVDPYQPALSSFAFTPEEDAVIKLALATSKPWDYAAASDLEKNALKSAKKRILAYHLARHGKTCCYCRSDLEAAGHFMIDREHILPKGKVFYRIYSYAMWNLAAACKRCNMQFKGQGDSFVIDRTNPLKYQLSSNYRFVHPNFDRWEAHLTRLSVQVNARKLVIITRKPGCAKADFTHAFFDLSAFEVDTFDAVQGLENRGIDSAAVLELRKLAKAMGQ